ATVGLGDLVQAGLVVLVFLVVPVVFLDGGFFYVLPRHGFVPPVTATATDGCFLGGWDILFEGLPSGLLLGGVTATTATATSTVTFFVLARVGVSRVLRTEGRCEGVGGLIEYRRSLFRESTTVTGAGLVLTSPATAPTPPGRFLVEDLGERTGVRGATHPRKTSGVEDIGLVGHLGEETPLIGAGTSSAPFVPTPPTRAFLLGPLRRFIGQEPGAHGFVVDRCRTCPTTTSGATTSRFVGGVVMRNTRAVATRFLTRVCAAYPRGRLRAVLRRVGGVGTTAQVGQRRQRLLGRVTGGSLRPGGTGTGCATAAQRIGGTETSGGHVGWFATTAASRPRDLIPSASLRVAGYTELTGRPNAVAGRSLRLFGPGCRGRTRSEERRVGKGRR